jgi:cofilin
MRSGIKPDEEVLAEFNQLKKEFKLKTMIFEINAEDSKLQCVFKGDKNFSYKDLFDKLPADEPRYIAYDFDYSTNENPPRKTNKLILILWCPQDASSKKKFLYSSSVAEIATTLGSIQKTFQVDDFAGMDYDEIRNQLLKC